MIKKLRNGVCISNRSYLYTVGRTAFGGGIDRAVLFPEVILTKKKSSDIINKSIIFNDILLYDFMVFFPPRAGRERQCLIWEEA